MLREEARAAVFVVYEPYNCFVNFDCNIWKQEKIYNEISFRIIYFSL